MKPIKEQKATQLDLFEAVITNSEEEDPQSTPYVINLQDYKWLKRREEIARQVERSGVFEDYEEA